MTINISPIDWKPLDGLELEEAALQVMKGEGNFCVIAGPGAGKTELLAQKASYLLQTGLCVAPRKILALSYKKDAEKNLKDRVTKRVGKDLASRFTSLTYDAFAKRLLDHFLSALPEEYRPRADYDVINSTNEVLTLLIDSLLSDIQKADLFKHFVKDIKLLPLSAEAEETILYTKVSKKLVYACFCRI